MFVAGGLEKQIMQIMKPQGFTIPIMYYNS